MSVNAPTAPGTSPRVAIVLVNFNGTTDTLKCLESLHALNPASAQVLVVDNGSATDPSGSIAEAHPWATVVHREENGGWAGGNNEGIRVAVKGGVDWIILLNNDTIVAPTLVERLLDAARQHPRFGILGPVICFMDEPSVVMTDGCDFNQPGFPGFFRRHEVPVEAVAEPAVVEVDIVNGCCIMISAEVFQRVGLIDERFFLIHEESDFCLRAQQAGFACGVLAEPLVWHKGSSTFKRSGSGLQRYYDARNLFLLLRKHQSAHHRGRGPMASWASYLRYVYHRYATEREQGLDEAADAVLQGLGDAISGRFGARPAGRRPAPALLRRLFEIGRRTRDLLAWR